MAQMPEQTNTIKRIYDILNTVIAYGDANMNTGSSASIAWTAALEIGVPEDLSSLLCDLIADVIECERIVDRDIRIDENIHLKHISRVKSGLLGVQLGNWESFRKTFDDGLLDILQLMSENMSMYVGEEVIPEEELASLQADVEDLINKVVDSDIDVDIRNVLFEGLEAVRDALLKYQVYGAEGIRNAVDKNVGSYARHKEGFYTASQTEWRGVINAYMEFINEVNVALSKALKFKPLAKPVGRILPMLGIGSDGCT